MSATDALIENARRYAASFDKGGLARAPARRVAVVACMDARLNPYALLGLREGDAHVIRNAGGVVTDHEIRSLAISQRALGTEEIVLVHHTDCGVLGFSDDEFKSRLEAEVGVRPSWHGHGFTDLDEDVRDAITRIKASPFLASKASVRGFVYDVEDGSLREIT